MISLHLISKKLQKVFSFWTWTKNKWKYPQRSNSFTFKEKPSIPFFYSELTFQGLHIKAGSI
jgi:hypothetical protein